MASPVSVRTLPIDGTGKRLEMLGMPSSHSIARSCIAARTPPN